MQFDRPEFERNINFLLGRDRAHHAGFASNGERYVEDLYQVKARYGELEFYFQDTWKVRRNLTIDLGLRWELRNEPGEANDLIARPNQTLVYGAADNDDRSVGTRVILQEGLEQSRAVDRYCVGPSGAREDIYSNNYRIAYDRLPTFGLSTIFQTLPGITLGVTNDEFGQNGGRLANLPQIESSERCAVLSRAARAL